MLTATQRKLLLLIVLLIGFCGMGISRVQAQPQQNPPLPSSNDTYLGYGDMLPIRVHNTTGYNSPYKTGPCQMLGKKFDHGFSVIAERTGVAEITFQLGGKYKRFRASVGIANSYEGDGMVTFTVIGRNAQGEEVRKTHRSSRSLRVTNPPEELDVPVDGVEELILTVNSSEADITQPGMVWWGNARLSASGASKKPGEDDPLIDGDKLLRYDQKLYHQAIQELAAKIKARFKGSPAMPSLAIARFALSPLPNQPLSVKNADDIQSDLRGELSNTDTFQLTTSKEAFTEVLRQNSVQLGDVFDAKTREELGKLVAAKYLLLGKISDRDDYFQITVSLYELSTGILRVDERVNIPILMPVVPKDEPGLPVAPPTNQLNLIFNPPANLRIERFEWFLDGASLGVVRNGSKSSVATTTTEGMHRLKLVWTGQGYYDKDAQKTSYESISADFTVNIKHTTTDIEVKPRVQEIFTKLSIFGYMEEQKFEIKWK